MRISHPVTYFVRLNLILPPSSVQTVNTELQGKGRQTVYEKKKGLRKMNITEYSILSGMYIC